MKKSMFLSLIVLGLVACGGGADSQPTIGEAPAPAQPVDGAATAAEPAAAPMADPASVDVSVLQTQQP